MSTRRTITVTLTEPQFRALAHAIAAADVMDEEPSISPGQQSMGRARERAWVAVRRAWHAAGKS